MTLETLLTRYKTLGYVPKGYERDLEVTCIIKWIYETYNIYVDIWQCTMKIGDWKRSFKKFQGVTTINLETDYPTRFTCEKYFDNPFDAKYDAVRQALLTVRNVKHFINYTTK